MVLIFRIGSRRQLPPGIILCFSFRGSRPRNVRARASFANLEAGLGCRGFQIWEIRMIGCCILKGASMISVSVRRIPKLPDPWPTSELKPILRHSLIVIALQKETVGRIKETVSNEEISPFNRLRKVGILMHNYMQRSLVDPGDAVMRYYSWMHVSLLFPAPQLTSSSRPTLCLKVFILEPLERWFGT